MATAQCVRAEEHVQLSCEQESSLNALLKESECELTEQTLKQAHCVCVEKEPHEKVQLHDLSVVAGAMRNCTKGSMKLLHEHNWSGHFVKKYPHCLNAVGTFVQTSHARKGCKSAVVYESKNCAGVECAFLLAWSDSKHAMRVYAECGPVDKFRHLNWCEIERKLDHSGKVAKHTDCCTGTTVVAKMNGVHGKAVLAATFSA